jgi:transcriptional regulator with XRE-family HTH domain
MAGTKKRSEFATRLQAAADYAGYGSSQSKMAASLGLARQNINRWMSGGEAAPEMIFLIAERWGVSAEWLAIGRGPMIGKGLELPHEQRELLLAFQSCDAQARSLLLEMVKAAGRAKNGTSLITAAQFVANSRDLRERSQRTVKRQREISPRVREVPKKSLNS